MRGLVIRTLEGVLRDYALPEGAKEALEGLLGELRAEPDAGPWTLDDGGNVRNRAGDVLAHIPYTLGDAWDRANARLICAAPELLAACRAVVGTPVRAYPGGFRGYAVNEDVIARVWAAIHKAEG